MSAIQLPDPPVPSKWGSKIEPWLQTPLRLSIPTPPDGARLLLELNVLTVQSGLHWMVREAWYSKYRHPKKFRRAFVSQTKNLGIWFKHIRNLCIQIHATAKDFGLSVQYESPNDWFYQIIEEFMCNGLGVMFYSLYPDSLEKYDDGTQKGVMRAMSNVCSRVKAYDKPESDSAFSDLINYASKISERADQFRDEEFTPFIKAWRNLIAEQKQWPLLTYRGNGDLYRQVGKGRRKVKLQMPKEFDR